MRECGFPIYLLFLAIFKAHICEIIVKGYVRLFGGCVKLCRSLLLIYQNVKTTLKYASIPCLVGIEV